MKVLDQLDRKIAATIRYQAEALRVGDLKANYFFYLRLLRLENTKELLTNK